MKYIPSIKINFYFNNSYCELNWIEKDSVIADSYGEEIEININDLNLSLSDIRDILSDIYSKLYDFQKKNAKLEEYQYLRELEGKIYNLTYKSIQNEGLTLKQAQTIMGLAYDHGHSAGRSEVVNYAIEFTNFAKEILNR